MVRLFSGLVEKQGQIPDERGEHKSCFQGLDLWIYTCPVTLHFQIHYLLYILYIGNYSLNLKQMLCSDFFPPRISVSLSISV